MIEERFQTVDAKNRFENYIENRKILLERPVVLNDFSNSNIRRWIVQRQLNTLSSMRNEVICDQVSEFYCNMYDVGANGFSTYVRGKHINMKPQVLADFLAIPRQANLEYMFPNPQKIPYILDLVASVICGKERQWDGNLILQKELQIDYHLYII